MLFPNTIKNYRGVEKALGVLALLEGEFTNDPSDPGGVTKWGVASRYHPEVLRSNFKKTDADSIFIEQYWKPSGANRIKSEILALTLFQISVHIGVTKAVTLLQSTLNICVQDGERLKLDGKAGTQTILKVNQMSETSTLLVEIALRASYMGSRIQRASTDKNSADKLVAFENRVTNNYYHAVSEHGVKIWSA
jgi:lysozyme family protein